MSEVRKLAAEVKEKCLGGRSFWKLSGFGETGKRPLLVLPAALEVQTRTGDFVVVILKMILSYFVISLGMGDQAILDR
jgi:hypothetical protein